MTLMKDFPDGELRSADYFITRTVVNSHLIPFYQMPVREDHIPEKSGLLVGSSRFHYRSFASGNYL